MNAAGLPLSRNYVSVVGLMNDLCDRILMSSQILDGPFSKPPEIGVSAAQSNEASHSITLAVPLLGLEET